MGVESISRLEESGLIFATGNPGKRREVSAVLCELDIAVEGLEGFSEIPEPEENGATFGDNARLKALYYARSIASTGRGPSTVVLADDSGLIVDALGGAPGVYSARYAAESLPPDASRADLDQANNRKLLEELRDVPDPQRTARFLCHLALGDPNGVLIEASGTIEGRIAHQPAGEGGFGYDPLFFLPALNCTTAELSAEQKNRISHRGQAVRQFATLVEMALSS